MNYHYFEFMIKEQRRDEREDCERRRLLKTAGHSIAEPVQKAARDLDGIMRWLKEKRVLRNKWLDTFLSITERGAQPKGEPT